MNKMYEYLKNHAYISYNKKSNYEFELSEERAKCIANKYDSLTEKLQQENKQLQKDIKNIIKILDKNCDDLEATEEEFDSLDRWQGLRVVELKQGSDSNDSN